MTEITQDMVENAAAILYARMPVIGSPQEAESRLRIGGQKCTLRYADYIGISPHALQDEFARLSDGVDLSTDAAMRQVFFASMISVVLASA